MFELLLLFIVKVFGGKPIKIPMHMPIIAKKTIIAPTIFLGILVPIYAMDSADYIY